MVSTGISGSTTVRRRRPGALPQIVGGGRRARSPCRSRVRALQILQLGQQMAEMLGVAAAAAALLHPVRVRQVSVARLDTSDDRGEPAGAQARPDRSRRRPRSARASMASASNSSPVNAHRSSIARLRAAMALGGAVAEPDHPFGGVAQVIGAFLLRLGGDRRQRRILRAPSSPANTDRRRPSRRTAAPWCAAKSPLGCSTSSRLR